MSVSVVIPALNAACFIRRAIDSALAQGSLLHEVIVVDDGSTDDTSDVVGQIAQSDPRVRLITLGTNNGPGPARNAGFAAATGDWIGILDADDAYLPGRLDYLVQKALALNLDLAADNLLLFDNVAGQISRLGIRPELVGPFLPVDSCRFVRNCRGNRNGSIDFGLLQPLMRTSFVRDHDLRYPDIRHGEDFAFCLDALLAGGRFGVFPEAYYVVTERTGSISRKSSGLSRTVIDYTKVAKHARERASDAERMEDRELALLLHQRAEALIRVSIISEIWKRWRARRFGALAWLVCSNRAVLSVCCGAGLRKVRRLFVDDAKDLET